MSRVKMKSPCTYTVGTYTQVACTPYLIHFSAPWTRNAVNSPLFAVGYRSKRALQQGILVSGKITEAKIRKNREKKRLEDVSRVSG